MLFFLGTRLIQLDKKSFLTIFQFESLVFKNSKNKTIYVEKLFFMYVTKRKLFLKYLKWLSKNTIRSLESSIKIFYYIRKNF